MSLKRSPNQQGVPRKATSAKQLEQGVPREEKPGITAKIWHGDPVPGGTTVPLSKMWHGDIMPSGRIVPLYLRCYDYTGYKRGISCNRGFV